MRRTSPPGPGQERRAAPGRPVPPELAHRLPPGQHLPHGWPVLHYGPVPRFRPERWDFRVFGATAGGEVRWSWDAFAALPRTGVTADLHCVTRFSTFDNRWSGVAASTVLELAPPAPDATHVLVWAEYGYSSSLELADLQAPASLFATHHDGAPLDPEHGHPLRLVVPHRYAWKGPKWVRGVQYLQAPEPGFWEQRGYHPVGDPWREQRWAHDGADGS